jgi:hypothetical protein
MSTEVSASGVARVRLVTWAAGTREVGNPRQANEPRAAVRASAVTDRPSLFMSRPHHCTASATTQLEHSFRPFHRRAGSLASTPLQRLTVSRRMHSCTPHRVISMSTVRCRFGSVDWSLRIIFEFEHMRILRRSHSRTCTPSRQRLFARVHFTRGSANTPSGRPRARMRIIRVTRDHRIDAGTSAARSPFAVSVLTNVSIGFDHVCAWWRTVGCGKIVLLHPWSVAFTPCQSISSDSPANHSISTSSGCDSAARSLMQSS